MNICILCLLFNFLILQFPIPVLCCKDLQKSKIRRTRRTNVSSHLTTLTKSKVTKMFWPPHHRRLLRTCLPLTARKLWHRKNLRLPSQLVHLGKIYFFSINECALINIESSYNGRKVKMYIFSPDQSE